VTFGGAETDHRSGAVLTALHVCFASLGSVVVVVVAVVVVTASNSRASLTRGGAETTVTLAPDAPVMSDLVSVRKLRNLRLENDDGDEGARDVLLVTRAGRALKYCTGVQLCIAVDFVADVVVIVVD